MSLSAFPALPHSLRKGPLLLFLPLFIALASCRSRATDPKLYLADPKVGDVYVIRFKPVGDTVSRYYFYQLYRVTADSALFHPARKESVKVDAAVSTPDFFAGGQTIAYTRRELPELLQEQPGDVLRTRLIGIRRGK